MEHTEKTLSVQEIFSGHVVRLTLDKVELENGRSAMREVVHHRGGACIAALTEKDELYLVRQYRYALGKTVNELCAGVIEKGEEPMAAARRELMEETGFGGGNWQEWMTISANPSTHTNLTHCFLATDVELLSEQHLDEGEDVQVRIFTRQEVEDMLQKGEVWQSLMAAPLWKYFALNQ